MAQRAFPWKVVLIAGSLGLLVALLAGYQHAVRTLVHGYYRSAWAPEPLGEADRGAPPPAHRLADVPWLSEPLALGHSASLRMLAAQQGRLEPRRAIDFLMGTTWGATPVAGTTGFVPGQDPEAGFLRGARYLGFTRRYLTTDDRDDFLLAVRTQLAKGRAVRVAVDRAALLEERGLVPHSLVLVGYDERGFEAYEPVCDTPKRCAPGDAAPGAPGLVIETGQLVMAVEALALALQVPWRYQLLVLEPLAGERPAPEELLALNGRALVGEAGPGPATGSFAVAGVARALERHGDGVLTPELLRGVRLAAVVREDDARTLSALFPGRADLAPAAERLSHAAKRYELAAKALEAKVLAEAVAALAEAAQADREAGELLAGAAN